MGVIRVGVTETPHAIAAETPPRFTPETLTTVPGFPNEGVSPNMEGLLGMTMKLLLLSALPRAEERWINPVTPLEGTFTVTEVLELADTVARIPPTEASLMFSKLEPETMVYVPTGPELGERPEIHGVGTGVGDEVGEGVEVGVGVGVGTMPTVKKSLVV